MWEVDVESMHKSYRPHPPGYISVQEHNREDEQTTTMVDEEGFFTYSFCSIDWILDRHIINIVNPRDEEEDSGDVIGP